VSVRTGEVLANVTASKTIASQALGASAFKYVAFRELLEAEAGITTNEPDQIALQQAIEKAVYGMVLQGVELDLWRFDDMAAAQPLIAAYRAERDGTYDASDIQEAVKRAGSLTALTIVADDKEKERRDGS
jgi:curli production assembly/transport component CsgG